MMGQGNEPPTAWQFERRCIQPDARDLDERRAQLGRDGQVLGQLVRGRLHLGFELADCHHRAADQLRQAALGQVERFAPPF
jgi:hypothetical protein